MKTLGNGAGSSNIGPSVLLTQDTSCEGRAKRRLGRRQLPKKQGSQTDKSGWEEEKRRNE